MAEEGSIPRIIKGGLRDMVSAEDLILESFQDLVRDEIKRRIREQLDADPELRAEFRAAIGMFFEAKVQEAYASLKLAKAGAKLSIEMLPEDLRKELSREVMATVEKELGRLLEKTL
ncbi:MAG TPA: hypothetical protein VM681_08870 [Candidatus Thermoplasmatota archaeon]|nr:hypothetical protein [Candidatus Thermoplasmatota archaeon]